MRVGFWRVDAAFTCWLSQEWPWLPWRLLMLVSAAVVLVAVMWPLPALLTRHPSHGLSPAGRLEVTNDVRATLVQALGGLALRCPQTPPPQRSIPANPGLTIFAYTAKPGSPSQEAFDLLASWTATRTTHPLSQPTRRPKRATARTVDQQSAVKRHAVPIQPKQPTAKGPAEWFTGDVYIDPIARGEDPSRVRVSAVRFTPGARTAWHSHALGQTLYVTEGEGLVQSRGGDIEEIHAGDVVCTPADEWHWHGAAPDHFMTHLSITEAVPGGERPEADWGEHVTDDEYKQR